MKPKSNDNKDLNANPDTVGYETIMRSLAAGVCRLDRAGAIIYANDSAARILGRNKVDLNGQSYTEVFFGYGVPKSDTRCAPIEFTLGDGEVSHVNTERFVRPDEADVLVEYMCVPLVLAGDPAGAVISFEDVTDRREVENAVAKAREEALAAARSKAEFLANMSHEIRTPLTGIIGTVELLNGTELDSDQSSYLQMLRSSTEFLHSIVNDILDFSKIEAGRFRSKHEPFSIEVLATECLDSFRSTSETKGLVLSYSIETSLATFVKGDSRVVQQILNNFLSNAIKFTGAGSVKLEVSSSNDGTSLRFCVSDTGIGIAATDQEKLFTAFTQADASDSRAHKGTGLGLAISKKLVELMNGKIGIESIPDKGTSIWFEIPLIPAGDIPSLPELQIKLDTRFEGLSILVVEDNPINLSVMQKMLERLGLGSDAATGGKEAVRACEAKDYDIVFMDCQMPDMDGFEAARRIKSNSGSPPVVIAFTASALNIESDAENGDVMDGILRKPFTENDLIDTLNSISEGVSTIKTLDLDTDIREHLISQFIDAASLERLSNLKTQDARGFLREILEVFSAHTTERLVEISGFADANDRKNVKRIAHNLKGSSANIGIGRLSGLFEELENGAIEFGEEKLKDLLHKIEDEFSAVNAAISELRNEDGPHES